MKSILSENQRRLLRANADNTLLTQAFYFGGGTALALPQMFAIRLCFGGGNFIWS